MHVDTDGVHAIANTTNPDRSSDIVFVHGLGGSSHGTWRHKKAGRVGHFFWPDELGKDIPTCGIWTIGYPAGLSEWGTQGMIIEKRAANLAQKLVNVGIGDRPIIFIAHSMGGLVIKSLIVESQVNANHDSKRIAGMVRGLVFCATPHRGSYFADAASILGRFFGGVQAYVKEMRANSDRIDILHDKFVEWHRKHPIPIDSYAENIALHRKGWIGKLFPLGIVVPRASANTGIATYIVKDVDADHITIVKPTRRQDDVYAGVLRFIKEVLLAPIDDVSLTPLGHTSLSWGNVVSFRQSYLVAATGELPFGGRNTEFSRLNSWLDGGTAPNRMLVTGPTGRGKSALLVRWTEAVMAEASWTVVFVPISIRFGTNRPGTFYGILATQLAQLLGKSLQSPAFDPEDFYLNLSSSLMQELANAMQQVLVVIDGIDEALDQRFNATIFPIHLPSNIKVLLSAREQANDNGPKGWLDRLGWQGTGHALSEDLSRLDRAAVAEVLQSVGFRFEQMANEVIDRVTELSEGEPLLVKLYAEDLWEIESQGERLTLADLEGLKPGFEPYFARAFDHQRIAWKDDGSNVSQDTIDATLAILASAFGPLQREHLVDLVCAFGRLPHPVSPDHFVRPLARFISGSGRQESGYVLNHPKLGQYLRDERFDPVALRAAHVAFAQWGRAEADLLAQNASLQPPPYVLQYHADHLGRVEFSLDDYAKFLSNGWRLAWERYEGGYRGYSANLQSILRALGSSAQHAFPAPVTLHIRVKIALCLASVKSLGANLPSELLSLGLDEGLLTLQQATHYIDLQLIENRPQYFAAMLRHIKGDEENKVVDLLYETRDAGTRAQVLAQIACQVSESRRSQVISDVLDICSRLDNPLQRLGIAIQLAPQLTDQQLSEALSDSLSIPVKHESGASCAVSIARLSEHFRLRQTIAEADRATQRCVELLDAASDSLASVDALGNLFEILSDAEVDERIDRLSSVVDSLAQGLPASLSQGSSLFEKEMKAGRVLKALALLKLLKARRLPPAEYDSQLTCAITLLSTLRDYEQVRLITELLPVVRSEWKITALQQCFQLAGQLPSANNRTHAMMALAKLASPPLRSEIVRAGLLNAGFIEDEYSRCLTLVALFAQLPANEKSLEINQLLIEVRHIPYVLHRGEILIELATHVPTMPELFDEGVQLILMTAEPLFRHSGSLNALSKLPGALRQSMFRYCWDHLFNAHHVFSQMQLASVAQTTCDLWSYAELRAAFDWFSVSSENWQRAHLLAALVPVAVRLGAEDIIDAAFAQTLSQQDPGDQLAILAKIVPLLDLSDPRRETISHVWSKSIREGTVVKPNALVDAYPLLSANDRTVAWRVVKAAAKTAGDAGILLGKLACLCPDQCERADLMEAAFSLAAAATPDNRIPAAAALALLCSSDSEKMRAIDLMTQEPWINRSSILGAIKRTAPVLATLGTSVFLRQLMADIRENAEWWP